MFPETRALIRTCVEHRPPAASLTLRGQNAHAPAVTPGQTNIFGSVRVSIGWGEKRRGRRPAPRFGKRSPVRAVSAKIRMLRVPALASNNRASASPFMPGNFKSRIMTADGGHSLLPGPFRPLHARSLRSRRNAARAQQAAVRRIVFDHQDVHRSFFG
jgi:hypothetical protein